MRPADELPDVLTFNSLSGGGCEKQDEVKKAEDVFEKMKSASELPDALKFNSLITQHGETKKTEEICEKLSAGEHVRQLEWWWRHQAR